MVGSMLGSVENHLPVGGGGVLPVHQIPQMLLQIQLNKLDLVAARRVRDDEDAPGPFGAATMAYNIRTGENRIIGDKWDSNRVNADGPQAHAEAVNVYPDRYAELKSFLEREKSDADWTVTFLSTGESCPSCFTKQHVIVNELIQAGLIEKGRVLNFYGADYDMTKEVAGFSDKDQLEDMVNHPVGAPITMGKASFVGHDILDLSTDVQQVFRESKIPVAVLMRRGEVYARAFDTRAEDNDPLATAEMSVVKRASQMQKETGAKEPWNLSQFELVSATQLHDAPLARTAMFWASIPVGIHMRDGSYGTNYNHLRTTEAPGMTNAQLYAAATDRPYNGQNALIHAFQAPSTGIHHFRNLAQHAWPARVKRDAQKGRSIHYDGGGAGGHGPNCC